MDGWNTVHWKKVQRTVVKLQKRISQASRRQRTVEGAPDKRQTLEEPCDGKLSRTVLKPSGGGDPVA
jgi:hypothetical protein